MARKSFFKYNDSVKLTEKEKIFSKPWVVCICAGFCSLLWGSAFPCVKLGYALFGIDTGDIPSLLLFAGIRFTVAGAAVIVAGSIAKRRFLLPAKNMLGYTALVCLFQTCLQYSFFYIGVANTSGVKSSVLNGLGVFFTILFACFLYRTERFTPLKLLGCILGFAGVVFINIGENFNFEFTLKGEGFVIFACMCSAVAAGLMKVAARRGDATAVCGWQFFAGGIALTVAGLAAGGRMPRFTTGGAFMLLYLAFLSACAFTLQAFLLRFNPVSKIAVFKSANPVFGVIFSAVLLGESDKLFSFYTLPALFFVCAGIVVINKFGEKSPKFKKRE